MQVPVDVLSSEDAERLIAYPDRDDVLGLRDAAVLGTLYYAAATAGEVAALDLGDVQLRKKQIVLRGEDGARRRVPMADELAALLRDYKERSRRLILAHGGGAGTEPRAFFLANRPHRIRVQEIRQILGANVKGAGIDAHANLTTLRLSRAWHLREQGTSPEAIQRFLGASSRSGRRVF